MAVKIAFKLHGKYADMALQLEASVDKEGWEIYESQQKIYKQRVAEYNSELVEKGKSTVVIPPHPMPPYKLTKEEICRRVFCKWMEQQLVTPEQVTLGEATDERTGNDSRDNAAVSNSQNADSSTLAVSEEQAAEA